MRPEELKSIRKELGWTQVKLADKVGVSRRAIQFWEKGERGIPKTVQMFMVEKSEQVHGKLTKVKRRTKTKKKELEDLELIDVMTEVMTPLLKELMEDHFRILSSKIKKNTESIAKLTVHKLKEDQKREVIKEIRKLS